MILWTLLLIIFFFPLEYLGKTKNIQFLVSFLFVLLSLFLFSVRGNVGADYFNYLFFFNYVDIFFQNFVDTVKYLKIEPLYIALISVVKTATNDFNVFLFFVSLLMYSSLVFFTYKSSVSPIFITFLYFCFISLDGHLVQIRMGIVYSLIFVLLIYLKEKKTSVVLLIASIASLFHYMGIFLFLFIICYQIKISPTKFISAIILSLIWHESNLLIQVLEFVSSLNVEFTPIYKLIEYQSKIDPNKISIINSINGLLFNFLIAFFLIYYKSKIHSTIRRYFVGLSNIYMVGIVLYIFFYENIYVADRILKIFMIPGLVSIALIFTNELKFRKNFVALSFLIVFTLYSILRFYLVINSESAEIIPYSTII